MRYGDFMKKSDWIKHGILILIVYLLYAWTWHDAFGEIPSSTLAGEAISHVQLEEELRSHIHFEKNSTNTIGHILIDDRTGGINQSTWLYVKSALDYYKIHKPIFIILELNTPGGEVFPAQQISDALKQFDTQQEIPVVAYINNWAISAGALLAYSCRFIVVVKDASMGAAEPLLIDAAGKMETASEKVNSALRTDLANRARFFERNPLLAEAMVDKDIILVLRDGKVARVDNESQIRPTDKVISPKGKLLTLNSEELIEFGVADLLLPPTKTDAVTTDELDKGRWSAQKEALFHQPFFDSIPNAIVDSYRMDWKMRFFAFLATPMVSSLLFLALVIGFYMELSTPGFGLAGTIALTSLFLIILSSFSLEIANWLELIFLVVGLVTVLVELFVLPTFGLLGFIGIVLFIIGLFGMMIPGVGSVSFDYDTKTLNAAGDVFLERLAWLCGTLVVAFGIIALLARYITPSLAAYSRLVLKGNEQVGYYAVSSPATLPKVDAEGIASTSLRPSGKVIIENQQYEAMSEGMLIDRGTPIRVVRAEGGTLIVRAVK